MFFGINTFHFGMYGNLQRESYGGVEFSFAIKKRKINRIKVLTNSKSYGNITKLLQVSECLEQFKQLKSVK